MKIKTILLFLFVGMMFSACSSDDYDGGFSRMDNQVNRITYKFYSNDPNVPVALYGEGIGSNSDSLYVKDYYKVEYTTKSWVVGFDAICDDPTVLLRGEVYVNGKLKKNREANKLLRIGYQIKGSAR